MTSSMILFASFAAIHTRFIMILRPIMNIVPEYCHQYINLVRSTNLLKEFETDAENTFKFYMSIPKEKEDFRYAPGKWTIKEILNHVADMERIFTYRALRFSRKDQTELSGFEQQIYNVNAKANKRTLVDLVNEFKSVRVATITLFSHLDDEMLDFRGVANNLQVSARIIGWMIPGHNIHHRKIITEKYL
jgi:uncharacterized damage-inducible protein DinB